ncbi:hypothetical protein VTJ04DRAFT_10863 [Mycothermus thermophilus]|uniref:uncharacterized protein n=1 Tax=Humicola insolens TaxID=85995 RepID=UPI0037446357
MADEDCVVVGGRANFGMDKTRKSKEKDQPVVKRPRGRPRKPRNNTIETAIVLSDSDDDDARSTPAPAPSGLAQKRPQNNIESPAKAPASKRRAPPERQAELVAHTAQPANNNAAPKGPPMGYCTTAPKASPIMAPSIGPGFSPGFGFAPAPGQVQAYPHGQYMAVPMSIPPNAPSATGFAPVPGRVQTPHGLPMSIPPSTSSPAGFAVGPGFGPVPRQVQAPPHGQGNVGPHQVPNQMPSPPDRNLLAEIERLNQQLFSEREFRDEAEARVRQLCNQLEEKEEQWNARMKSEMEGLKSQIEHLRNLNEQLRNSRDELVVRIKTDEAANNEPQAQPAQPSDDNNNPDVVAQQAAEITRLKEVEVILGHELAEANEKIAELTRLVDQFTVEGVEPKRGKSDNQSATGDANTEKALEQANQELQETKDRITELEAELENTRAELIRVESQLSAANAVQIATDNHLAEAEANVASLSEQLKAKDQQLQQTEEALADMKRALGEAKVQLDKAKSSISAPAQDANNDALEADQSNLVQEKQTLEQERQALENELKNLRAEVDELNVTLSMLQETNETLAAAAEDRDMLKERLAEARKTLEDLETNSDPEIDQSNLVKEKRALEDELNNLRAKVDELTLALSTLQEANNRLASAANDRDEVEKRLAAATNDRQMLEERLADAIRRLESLQKQNDELEVSFKLVCGDNEALEDRLVEQSDELSALANTSERLRNSLRDALSHVEQLKGEVAEHSQTATLLEQEKQNIIMRLQVAFDRASKWRAKFDILKRHYDNLKLEQQLTVKVVELNEERAGSLLSIKREQTVDTARLLLVLPQRSPAGISSSAGASSANAREQTVDLNRVSTTIEHRPSVPVNWTSANRPARFTTPPRAPEQTVQVVRSSTLPPQPRPAVILKPTPANIISHLQEPARVQDVIPPQTPAIPKHTPADDIPQPEEPPRLQDVLATIKASIASLEESLPTNHAALDRGTSTIAQVTHSTSIKQQEIHQLEYQVPAVRKNKDRTSFTNKLAGELEELRRFDGQLKDLKSKHEKWEAEEKERDQTIQKLRNELGRVTNREGVDASGIDLAATTSRSSTSMQPIGISSGRSQAFIPTPYMPPHIPQPDGSHARNGSRSGSTTDTTFLLATTVPNLTSRLTALAKASADLRAKRASQYQELKRACDLVEDAIWDADVVLSAVRDSPVRGEGKRGSPNNRKKKGKGGSKSPFRKDGGAESGSQVAAKAVGDEVPMASQQIVASSGNQAVAKAAGDEAPSGSQGSAKGVGDEVPTARQQGVVVEGESQVAAKGVGDQAPTASQESIMTSGNQVAAKGADNQGPAASQQSVVSSGSQPVEKGADNEAPKPSHKTVVVYSSTLVPKQDGTSGRMTPDPPAAVMLPDVLPSPIMVDLIEDDNPAVTAAIQDVARELAEAQERAAAYRRQQQYYNQQAQRQQRYYPLFREQPGPNFWGKSLPPRHNSVPGAAPSNPIPISADYYRPRPLPVNTAVFDKTDVNEPSTSAQAPLPLSQTTAIRGSRYYDGVAEPETPPAPTPRAVAVEEPSPDVSRASSPGPVASDLDDVFGPLSITNQEDEIIIPSTLPSVPVQAPRPVRPFQRPPHWVNRISTTPTPMGRDHGAPAPVLALPHGPDNGENDDANQTAGHDASHQLSDPGAENLYRTTNEVGDNHPEQSRLAAELDTAVPTTFSTHQYYAGGEKVGDCIVVRPLPSNNNDNNTIDCAIDPRLQDLSTTTTANPNQHGGAGVGNVAAAQPKANGHAPHHSWDNRMNRGKENETGKKGRASSCGL